MKLTIGGSWKFICQLTVGSISITVGFALIFMLPSIVNVVRENVLLLKPGGIVFNLWRNNPMPSVMEIYFFNWTNPEDINNPDIKPHFNEIGPFVFKETSEKVNITWNSNSTVTFRRQKNWYFDETRSQSNLSTRIVTINVVALSSAYGMRFKNYMLKKAIDFSLRLLSHEVHVEKTIGEMLFEGYSDPLIAMHKLLPPSSGPKLPDHLDKFGLLYRKNGSTLDGIFNVGTRGSDFGSLLRWNYENKSSYYNGKCNAIKGSSGEFYPRQLGMEKIALFSSDICRSFILDYSENITVEGTQGYKFLLGKSFFDNGAEVPENKCYTSGKNVPFGVFNMSSCLYGTPSFMSLPHFYSANNCYLGKLEGLQPNKEKHEMFMIIEPTTGVPLKFAVRFQINFLLQPIEHILMYSEVPTLYFPVMWLEQRQYPTMPSSYRFYLELFLRMPTILKSAAGILICLGILFFICAISGDSSHRFQFQIPMVKVSKGVPSKMTEEQEETQQSLIE